MAPSGSLAARVGTVLLLVLAPAMTFVLTALDRGYQTDFWHHLARGREIIQQGRLIDEDLFTYTIPGQPLQDCNWLTQVLFLGLYQAGGLDLVRFVHAATLAGTMALLVLLCQRQSGSLPLAAAMGLFTLFGLLQVVIVIRPQTFSMLFFVLIYGALSLAETRRWLLAVPPVVMAMWTNMHGGFPIGFFPIGCFLLAAAWEARTARGWRLLQDTWLRALLLCLGASMLATLANPYTWRVYQYVVTVSGVASGRPIVEWQPPGPGLFIGKMWVASLLLLVVAFALPGGRPTVRELILLCCFLPLACGAVRMVVWWLIVLAPIVAAQLAAGLPRSWLERTDTEEGFPVGAAGILGALAVSATLSTPGVDRWVAIPESIRTVDATTHHLDQAIERLPPSADPNDTGRVFCPLEWGEYLDWAIQPNGYRVFMDGRIEIFPPAIWDEYMAVIHARADWQEVLDRHQVHVLLLSSDHENRGKLLLPFVEASKAWVRQPPRRPEDEAGTPRNEGGNVVLFVRRSRVG